MDSLQLTPAEHKIAELLLCAQQPEMIANTLHQSPTTISQHLSRMYRKFGLHETALYVPVVKLAMLIHEQREALGIPCQLCEYISKHPKVSLYP
jgi:DNA-binding NarL/FixJ family response regulator